VRSPEFVVVGTPRSGTTLVQRLASELTGVRIPPETHFLSDFVSALTNRWPPPLSGPALRDALADYAGRDYLEGVPFDVDAVVDSLGGACPTIPALYVAIVHHLAGSPPDTDEVAIGEKTPTHLLWWKPLARVFPRLKFVAVVRDPRAVVASNLEVGWSAEAVAPAVRWNDDVRLVRSAAAALGRARVLRLRYEDVVDDPGTARARLGSFLGRPVAGPPAESGGAPLFASWETWKRGATGAIDPARRDRWRDTLTPGQAADVAAVCRAGMASLAYADAPARRDAWERRARLPVAAHAVIARQAARRARRRLEIARLSRHWTIEPS
jgi:hypothetical protein